MANRVNIYLPVEVLVKIWQFSSPTDVSRWAQVNKLWYASYQLLFNIKRLNIAESSPNYGRLCFDMNEETHVEPWLVAPQTFAQQFDRAQFKNLQVLVIRCNYLPIDLNQLNRFQCLTHLEITAETRFGREEPTELHLLKLRRFSFYRTDESKLTLIADNLRDLQLVETNNPDTTVISHPESIEVLSTDMEAQQLSAFPNVKVLSILNEFDIHPTILGFLPNLRKVYFDDFDHVTEEEDEGEELVDRLVYLKLEGLERDRREDQNPDFDVLVRYQEPPQCWQVAIPLGWH